MHLYKTFFYNSKENLSVILYWLKKDSIHGLLYLHQTSKLYQNDQITPKEEKINNNYTSQTVYKFEAQDLYVMLNFYIKFYVESSMFALSNYSQYTYWILNIIIQKLKEVDGKN